MGEIFLRLLNMSITASWLILAVLCVRFLFRKMPKWVNCLLWGMVAMRLIFPFSIESSLSLQPSAEPIQLSTVVSGEILSYVPSVDSNFSVVENTVNPILAETFAYSEAESVAPLQVFTEIAGIVWIIGMIILLVYAMGSMIRLSLLVRESVWYKDNVYICDAVKSPFILGIIRPRIYLSSSLSEEEIEYIIAHERAHLKRKDYLWKPFGYLLLCIYWFNPLCWVAYIMLCKDIELACDEKVIRDMNFEDKKEYSRVLLSCATQRRLVMVCPLAFGEVGVKDRVKSVLNYKKPSFWIVLLSVFACVVVAVCFLTEPKSDFSIADYREISYGEYQKLTGYDAEFYHALYYIGKLPETELAIVFGAEYDEDLAGAVLSEDAKAIRIQGKLSELFGKNTKQFSESELLKKISENYGNVISIDYREGQNTAYYVGDYYAHILVASDADNMNTVFEIAVENRMESEKMFSGSSSFWLIWEEEESVKENENLENEKDDNGYIWLSDTVFISELEDLDGNGTKEYVEVDLGDESNNFYSHFKFYWNDEVIYEYEDPCRIDPCVAEYIDLDRDGEKEIFFSFAPRVNSMPLGEYIVLKQNNSSWKPLEMIHGETMTDNAFPLSVTKGNSKWQAVISCENLDKTVTFDVELYYLDLKRKCEVVSDNGGETEFISQLVERYETEFIDYPSGEICGNVSAWGIWNIEVGEYEGHPCLIAAHGIQCYDNFDFWGEADVYFDYDETGNTRFLDIQFRPAEPLFENKETEERIYEGEAPSTSYGDIAERYYTVGQYMKEVKAASKAMVVAGDSYICDEYLYAIGSPEAEPVYVLRDLNNDGIEEFFIGLKFNYDTPYYEIYDVYTWKDGRAYQLMRGIGYRNGSCEICKNGVIEDNYSGSAWDWQMLYHVLPEGGIELETIDSVTSTIEGTVQVYYHRNNLVDENTVQTIMEQYQPESVTYVECNRETIEQLRLSGIRKQRKQVAGQTSGE